MAFVISEADQKNFSDAQKRTQMSHTQQDERAHHHSEAPPSPITSQLYLKSSKALTKDDVLRRIRHHKCMSKVRSAFHGLVSDSTVLDQKWLDQNDNFSFP